MRDAPGMQPIRDLIEGCWPGEWGADPIDDRSNCIVYRATDIDDEGHVDLAGGAERHVPLAKLQTKSLKVNDILLEASGGAPDKPVGRVALITGPSRKPAVTSNFFRFMRPKSNVDAQFLTHQLVALNRSSAIWRYQQQTTGLINLKVSDYLDHAIWAPSVSLQRKIAGVLANIDVVIETSEALIEKYQQIKAGLMHDLFTRGVLPNGKLRRPREYAPDLYHETSLGWLPTDWDARSATTVLESIVDGPFGSNLKTEHYVVGPGVRVVRLQNVVEYEYNDADPAFVSIRHAHRLARNRVVAGDVLIAGLGEERYPVGRSCSYPSDLPPAINKADCFRARCKSDVMKNEFFMLFLNSELARRQIRRYEQGVTRPRINTGNLKRLMACVPSIQEQARIIERFETIQIAINRQQASVDTLCQQKLGLMQDLLTGKVPVKVDLPAPEPVDA